MRVSKSEGSQKLDLQQDALIEAGIDPVNIYEDMVSGSKDQRPGLDACLKALRENDTLIVWSLDRLGRSLKHLVVLVEELHKRKIGFKVLTGSIAGVDTKTASGKLVFNIFAALAEFERELIIERTQAGIKAARARGRIGGAPAKMTPQKIRMAAEQMKDRNVNVTELCSTFNITRQTLYRYISPEGEIRQEGKDLIERTKARRKNRSDAEKNET
jgi:DNA invertase Pin-like site-specific DNA recombinase